MDYFNYKINKDNVLFDANPKDVVQFKILYDMEHKYWFSKFHDHIFEKIIVLDNIIEFYIIDRKDKVKLSNWYQMEDVYPFLYALKVTNTAEDVSTWQGIDALFTIALTSLTISLVKLVLVLK